MKANRPKIEAEIMGETDMSKTYLEVLGAWVKRRDSSKRDANLVAFLAVRKDVKAAVDAGYPVKTVWTQLHEAKKVTYGYETFLNYVNRFIRRVPVETANEAVAQAAVKETARKLTPGKKPTPRPPTKPPEAIPGFTFNSSPKKEDLL
jgi:hypothetical protein